MSNSVLEVEVKAALPTNGGCAVFLGSDEKAFVIYVDQMVGSAIMMFIKKLPKARPQTHDLFGHMLTALGAKVQRVVINDVQDGIYYGRLILLAENELTDKKIVEIDARPSDCIALALQFDAPIYVGRSVWEQAEDMTDILDKVEGFQIVEGDEIS
jgi:bifunctional DNase/RNase